MAGIIWAGAEATPPGASTAVAWCPLRLRRGRTAGAANQGGPSPVARVGHHRFRRGRCCLQGQARGRLQDGKYIVFGHLRWHLQYKAETYQAARFMPALAEHHANGVCPSGEGGLRRSRIENPFLVVSPGRIKHMIADSAAIEWSS